MSYIRFFKLFIPYVIFMSLSSCILTPNKIIHESEHGFDFDPSKDELLLEEVELAKKTRFELGLALSGGGIRSSAYSIGVMKALHEQGVLQEIDIISSVSGGGYAAYWLLSSESNDKNKFNKFGDIAFEDENFLVNTCRFMTVANFVTLKSMAIQFLKNRDMSKFYQCHIERTYGWGDFSNDEESDISSCIKNKISSKSKTIDQYAKDVKNGYIPYFIYNSSVVDPKPKSGWADGLYEFTPLFRGNKILGYKKWEENKSLPLSQVSAIAGAATERFLGQYIDNPDTEKLKQDKIRLSDGGHSENLGVIALVRRGVKFIIVADGEQDYGLNFEAYYILKDRLDAWGYTLEYSTLDARPKKSPINQDKWWLRKELEADDNALMLKEGNFIATIYKTNDPEKKTLSTLFYIKSSVVGEIVKDADKEYFCNGLKSKYLSIGKIETENAKICNIINNDDKDIGNGDCSNNKNMVCQNLKRHTNEVNVKEWIKQNAIIRIQNKESFGKRFPHDSTLFQSFYIDQFTSYMGLGYLQTNKFDLKKLIDEKNDSEI